MAFPLLGAALFGGVISKVVESIFSIFSRKLGLFIVLIGVFTTLYAGVVVSLNLVLGGLSYLDIPSFLQYGFSVLPSNTDDCIGIVTGARLAVSAYDYHKQILDYKFYGG